MRTFIITLLIFAAYSAGAQSILRLINNTDKSIYVAITHRDNENHCWTSEGWFEVKAYSELNKNMGQYEGKVYIHGYQSTYMGLSSKKWGEGFTFCIDPENAFTIRDADKIDCKNKAEFSVKYILDGINKWEFNP